MSDGQGEETLWEWFGLSYASFCVMSRVMMHQMPDEWQSKMAKLMEEFDEAWPQRVDHFDGCRVTATKRSQLVKMPAELINYRHPDLKALEQYR